MTKTTTRKTRALPAVVLAAAILVCSLFAAATLSPRQALADPLGTNVEYTWDSVERTLTLSATGEDASFSGNDWAAMKTQIGDSDFEDITSFTVTGPSIIKAEGDLSGMFQGCDRLERVDLSKVDFSETTSMNSMFQGCVMLASFDISSLDMSSVTTADKMFEGIEILNRITCNDVITAAMVNALASLGSSGFESRGLVYNKTNKVVTVADETQLPGSVSSPLTTKLPANHVTLSVPNGARLVIPAGATLEVSGTLMNSGTIANHGTLATVASGASVINSNLIDNANVVSICAGSRLSNSGSLNNTETTAIISCQGTIYNSAIGTISICPGSTIAASGDGALTNEGAIAKEIKESGELMKSVPAHTKLIIKEGVELTVPAGSELVIEGEIEIAAEASLNIEGKLINKGMVTNYGEIVNSGTFDTQLGSVRGPGAYTGYAAQKPTFAAPDAPELESVTTNSITIKPMSGCEYRINDGKWEFATTFTGLSPSTSYSIYARRLGNDYVSTSPASPALVVTTLALPGSENPNGSGNTGGGGQPGTTGGSNDKGGSGNLTGNGATTGPSGAGSPANPNESGNLTITDTNGEPGDNGSIQTADSPRANKLTKATLKFAVKAKTLNKAKKKVFKTSPKVASGKAVTSQITGGGNKAAKKYKKLFSIAKKTGKITVKKGLPKGTYKLKVKFSSAKTAKYKAFSITKTVTITVK